ncbi:MAG: hypothetical protein U5Q16_14885 [Gammaproteobacteria bacterium]|nr:hypothetical protein [Gammaproteobacteria bacterium]
MKLALQTTPPEDEDFDALIHALRPLSATELSLRRAMEGELRHTEWFQPEDSWSGLFFKRRHMLSMKRRMLAPFVEETEMSGAAFWERKAPRPWQPTWWDVLFDPIGSRLASVAAPAYAPYSESLQLLRVQAVVLRAWAATLSGKARPSPGTMAEGLSNWIWQQDGKSLCLRPTAKAVRASDADSVCL